MKKHLLLLLLLTSTLCGFCQYQSIFGDSTTTWNVYDGYPDGMHVDTISTRSDTIIDGLSYKKMRWDCMADEVITPNFFLREDTVVGKIWYRASPASEEILVINLNLEAGDPFMFPDINYFPDYNYTEVDTIFYKNGRKRVRLYYGIQGNWLPLEFIEGAGSNGGPVWFPFNNSSGALLLCQHKDALLVYQRDEYPFEGTCVEPPGGITNNAGAEVLSLFPNPAMMYATLELPTHITQLRDIHIYDMYGKLVMRMTVYEPGEKINISNFPSGIYMIQSYFNQTFISGKLIKL